jgi:hypothetical protein
MSHPNHSRTSADTHGNGLRYIFFVLAIVLSLVHVFVNFRGLSSATGMDQAQLAREIARGNGFQTKVIRPYAWAQTIEAAKNIPLNAMPDLWQPPLQPVLLAPAFKLLERWSIYVPERGSTVFILDRVVACYGVVFFLLAILLTHGAASRLFDDKIAGITAICLIVCQPLWGLATSGSPLTLLMLEFAAGFRLFVSAIRRAQAGQSAGFIHLLLGVVCAAMLLTHWMSVWLIAGFIIAALTVLPSRVAAAVPMIILTLLTATAWGYRNYMVCGDPLGATKTLFQAMIFAGQEDVLLRDFSINVQAVDVQSSLKELTANWADLLDKAGILVGSLVVALLFPLALVHRFKNAETSLARWALAAIFAAAVVGLGLAGIREDFGDEHNLLAVLTPILTAFGVAMLATAWSRFSPQAGPFWSQAGYALIAIALSALPMIARLPTALKAGLAMRNQLAHWPPYLPERVAVLPLIMEPNEIIAADAPWFSAWYADVTSVWIPAQRSDFEAMRKTAADQKSPFAGFLITPISAAVPEYLGQIFEGPYSEWPDLVFRGPMLGFDREFVPFPDFPYKVPVPLVPFTVSGGDSQSMLMAFYTDRQRKIKKREE